MVRALGSIPARTLAALLGLAVVAGAWVIPPGTAAAQPRAQATDTERARELFERGLAELQREAWDEARELFEEAWSLAPRPSILVNLGTAQRQSGHLVEAQQSYRTFLERFPTHELAAQVRSSLAEVESLMPQLTIQVEGSEPGDEVFLDDERVETLGVPFATDPGLRAVSLRRGDRTLQTVRVRVELQGREEVFLSAVDLGVAGGGPEGPGAAAGGGDDTALIVGLVVGAVALVGGAVALGVVLGTQDGPRESVLPTVASGVITFE